VRAELILGMIERDRFRHSTSTDSTTTMPTSNLDNNNSVPVPVEHEPSTKPDYLRQRLHYTADGKALIDSDKDAVMMQWEAPLMKAHAQILVDSTPGKRVLNVGFGMGIIDSYLQELAPSLHIIIEAHPDVYKRMLTDGWDKKPNVRICFGKWQDVMPLLIQEGVQLDGIFFDTYGEHFLDLEEFHSQMVHVLSKPNGIYSFFNGLAPDNLFFHGVSCQCVKLFLSQLGMDSEFLQCEIQVKDEEWEGIRRKYWHGRDTYYLPRCTWNPQYLATGAAVPEPIVEEARKNKQVLVQETSDNAKRQRL
jgi:protein arginine N-methyltransferase 2